MRGTLSDTSTIVCGGAQRAACLPGRGDNAPAGLCGAAELRRGLWRDAWQGLSAQPYPHLYFIFTGLAQLCRTGCRAGTRQAAVPSQILRPQPGSSRLQQTRWMSRSTAGLGPPLPHRYVSSAVGAAPSSFLRLRLCQAESLAASCHKVVRCAVCCIAPGKAHLRLAAAGLAS